MWVSGNTAITNMEASRASEVLMFEMNGFGKYLSPSIKIVLLYVDNNKNE